MRFLSKQRFEPTYTFFHRSIFVSIIPRSVDRALKLQYLHQHVCTPSHSNSKSKQNTIQIQLQITLQRPILISLPLPPAVQPLPLPIDHRWGISRCFCHLCDGLPPPPRTGNVCSPEIQGERGGGQLTIETNFPRKTVDDSSAFLGSALQLWWKGGGL